MTSVLCKACRGTGEVPCNECNSDEQVKVKTLAGAGVCSVCDGKGNVKCPYCLGFGLVDFPAVT